MLMTYRIFLHLLCFSASINTLIAQVDTVFYRNGIIKKIEMINHTGNKLVLDYDTSGRIQQKTKYGKNAMFLSEKLEYRTVDTVKTIFRGFVDKNGNKVLHGNHCTYFNNEIQNCIAYEYGRISGYVIAYKNGKIISKVHYENGMMNGLFLKYYTNSQIKTKGKYKDGKRQGVWREYFKNGNMKSKGKYTPSFYIVQYDSFDDFTFKVLDENMEIVKSSNYCTQVNQYLEYIKYEAKRFDLPHYIFLKNGKWEYWSEDGTLIKTEYYDKGNLIEK